MRVGAIDQGTTSTRMLVADDGGNAEIAFAARHSQHRPVAGWVEHNPAEILANVHTCIEAAGKVDAIAIANQGESCLAWDAVTREALSPIIVWQDSRTETTTDRMRAEGCEAATLERAGLPLDPYFSASKLGWLIEHNDEVRRALNRGRLRLGTTDAYFLDRLTGNFATDATTASRTSLMNLERGEWDHELCRMFGVPVECLPEIKPTVSMFGAVGKIPITASIVDQQASLYGHGCRRSGDAKITFGTGAFVLAVTGSEVIRAPKYGLIPTIAWKIGDATTYAVDGGVYDASSAVEWIRSLGLFEDLSEIASFDGPTAIERELAFVPALSGLGCPHWDRSAGAVWIGMHAGTTKADLCQSVLEGVAFSAGTLVAAIEGRFPLQASLSIDGGLARNAYFGQFLSEVTNRPILTQRFHELTAFGCAAFAALGLGLELPAFETASTCFSPHHSAQEVANWQSRFNDAVRRAKKWRRCAPIPDSHIDGM